MSRSICIVVLAFVSVCASSVLANAQAAPSQTDSGNAAPVAFVYVTSPTDSSSYEINAYAASANGVLTAVPGSPFAANGPYLGANRRWLFSTDTVNIDSFAIGWNGALKEVSAIDAQQYNLYPTGGPVSLFFDRSGTMLYDEDIYADGANNAYQFFDLTKGTGGLSYLGATATDSAAWITTLSFVGNNAYAYGASCVRGDAYIFGFSRSGDGTLTDLNITPAIPTAPKGGYCPYLTAADDSNHVAISLTPMIDGLTPIGAARIAVYTADGSGDLTTNSTSANMPKVAVGSVIDMKTSPSGKVLAIAGTSGVQVFHFNGANSVTAFSGLITRDEVDQMFWDDANHLYAVSLSAGKLFVFTVTETGCRPAPGSPYTIGSPFGLAVSLR